MLDVLKFERYNLQDRTNLNCYVEGVFNLQGSSRPSDFPPFFFFLSSSVPLN